MNSHKIGHDGAWHLRVLVDDELERLGRARAIAVAEFARLDNARAALGYHPNHVGYLFGAAFASRDMGATHILPLAGFHRLPHVEAVSRISATGADDLLVAVRLACDNDQELEAAGFAWLGDRGLLKRGALDRHWLRHPQLGLGQPAKEHGLLREDHEGHRGLWSLDAGDLGARFAAVAPGEPDRTFGGLLLRVIEAGGPALAERGAHVVHREAKARYDADCASFAAHQEATDDRRWRGKPARSAQGHLAIRTAAARDLAPLAERTRGDAADWLDRSGANVRYREEG